MNIFPKNNIVGETMDSINFNYKAPKADNKQKVKPKPTNPDYNDLLINKIETDKNKLNQRPLMEQNIIPKHPGVSLFVGSISSGKTTLINNLLIKPQFYGPCDKGSEKPKPYFDHIFLLTGSDDDMYDELIKLKIIKEEHIKFDPNPSDIERILTLQQKTIKNRGLLKSPKILIILEDVVDNKALLNSKACRSIFIKPRQNNLSVWILAQYINLIPKSLRLQAINLFCFQQERAGEDVICQQYCPGTMKKDTFLHLIKQATEKRPDDEYPFLHINRRVKINERFRRNLNKIINIDNYKEK